MVVAAVIERDGHVLVCQRKQGRRHALKWEFPGGKVERGESPRAALEPVSLSRNCLFGPPSDRNWSDTNTGIRRVRGSF